MDGSRTDSLPRPPEAPVPCRPKSQTIAHSAGLFPADDLAPLFGAWTIELGLKLEGEQMVEEPDHQWMRVACRRAL
jgi:hypothetical protein